MTGVLWFTVVAFVAGSLGVVIGGLAAAAARNSAQAGALDRLIHQMSPGEGVYVEVHYFGESDDDDGDEGVVPEPVPLEEILRN